MPINQDFHFACQKVHQFFSSRNKKRIVLVGASVLSLFTLAATAVIPSGPDTDLESIHIKTITEVLAIPLLSQQIAQLSEQSADYVQETTVRYGDTLASLLGRLGVIDPKAQEFIQSNPIAANLIHLKAGKNVQTKIDDAGQLIFLHALIADKGTNNWANLTITRQNDQFSAQLEPAAIETRIEMRSGKINSSLFAATDSAQVPDTIANQLVDMLSTEIDFATDLRRGDRFNIIYETYWQNGQKIGSGRILAGDFYNKGKQYQAVWFESSKGAGGYYSFDGRSLKKAFLLSPLRYTRISSGFSMRKNPYTGKWAQHSGVDFAAVTGTPIHATADGTVAFIGEKTGYGNLVVLKNWGVYSTAYAHMSHFAKDLKMGMKVHQGAVIGYVGQTGWATGPHLHYELRVNNVAENPLTAAARIAAHSLNPKILKQFKSVTGGMKEYIAILDIGNSNQLASATN